MYKPRYQNEQTDLVMKAMLSLKDIDEAYRFCEDILTMQELHKIALRLEVAMMLRQKTPYQEIAHKTGASTTTISRVNRSLLYGADSYNILLNRVSSESGAMNESIRSFYES